MTTWLERALSEPTIPQLRAAVRTFPDDVDARVALAWALVTAVVDAGAPTARDVDEIVDLLRSAASGPVREKRPVLVDLGMVLAWRSSLADDPAARRADRDEAIDCLTDRVDDHFLASIDLFDLLLDRAVDDDGADDLDAAIRCGADILRRLPNDDANEARIRFRIGLAHEARWNAAGSPADRDSAITLVRSTRDLLDDGHEARAEVAAVLGPLLAQRIFAGTPDFDDDIAEALAELDLAAAGSEAHGRFLRRQHAMLHATRYLCSGGEDLDRERALTELTDLLDDPALEPAIANSARLVVVQLRLTEFYPAGARQLSHPMASKQVRSQILGTLRRNPAELPKVLEDVRRQLDLLSDEDAPAPELAGWLSTLKAMVAVHDPATRSEEALDEAVEQVGNALDLETDDDNREIVTGVLAAMHSLRADKKGTPEDANKAVDLITDLVGRLDEDDPLRGLMRTLLGYSVTALREATPPEVSSVAEGIKRMERVLGEYGGDTPGRAKVISDLTTAIGTEMMVRGSTEGIDDLRRLLRSAAQERTSDAVGASVIQLMLAMLNGYEGALTDDADLLSAALDDIRITIEKLPADNHLHAVAGTFTASMLAQRYLVSASHADLEAAQAFLDQVARSAGPLGAEPASALAALPRFGELTTKLARFQHGGGEDGLLDEIVTGMEELSPFFPANYEFDGKREGARLRKMVGSFTAPQSIQGVQARMRRKHANTTTSADTDPVPGRRYWPRRNETLMSAAELVNDGYFTGDLASLDRGIAVLGGLCSSDDFSPREKVKVVSMLAIALVFRHERSRRPQDLSNAIVRLEEACRLARQETGVADVATLHFGLGECYHRRGDHHRRDFERASDSGLAALRERAGDVLLQTGARWALETAESAAGEAADVTRWCLAAGRPELAVRALEMGRAMVLHTVTAERTIPGLLRDNDSTDLAAEWADEAREDRSTSWGLPGARLDPSGPEVPSDLRRRVLAALAGTEAESGLFSPPPVPEIAAALTRAGAAAMVYLLPRAHHERGLALVVHPDGRVTRIPLPALDCADGGPVDLFERAGRERVDTPDGPDESWRKTLEDLLDWSWHAAMATLVDELASRAGSRPARVVLVPVGKLGSVPWHAARRPVNDGFRFACEDLAVSYAASARQFVDATSRTRRPWAESAAMVRVEDQQLNWPPDEVDGIRDHCYPDCAYLGDPYDDRSRGVEPADVLAHLPGGDSPGASVLHLSCHAAQVTPAVESHLLLRGRAKLLVGDVLGQARHRPADRSGGLVVLSACATDLTEQAHDEALTLTTAFLSAGAVGVVGARWPVGDLPTALFMVMFHHYLNHGYEEPASALRATQRWMLDPARRVPDWIPRRLRAAARRIDLSSPANWAAFTYQGQ